MGAWASCQLGELDVCSAVALAPRWQAQKGRTGPAVEQGCAWLSVRTALVLACVEEGGAVGLMDV